MLTQSIDVLLVYVLATVDENVAAFLHIASSLSFTNGMAQ